MHGRTTGVSATISTILLTVPAIAGDATDRHPWADGAGPERWPVQRIEFSGAPTLDTDGWTAERVFADGTHVRTRVLSFEGNVSGVQDLLVTLPDGRRLGPVCLEDPAANWYSTLIMGQFDEDPDPEFLFSRDIIGNGSVFGCAVDVLDPVGPADAASRPLSYQSFGALSPGVTGIADVDGDGRPEFLVSDMVRGEAEQCTDGRPHHFFAFSPHRIERGMVRNVADELPGWPYLIFYSHRPRSNRTTRIRSGELEAILTTGRFRSPNDPAPYIDADAVPPRQDHPALTACFRDLGVEGSIVIVAGDRHDRAEAWEHRHADNDRRSPAGTSDVAPRAFAAVGAGVVTDPQAIVPWDGCERGWFEWDRDLSVAEAVHAGASWVLDGLDDERRATGASDLGAFLALGDATDGDRWISPREQVAAWRRAWRSARRAGAATQDLRAAMPTIAGDGWTVRGTTAWAAGEGWHVGWVERPGRDRV